MIDLCLIKEYHFFGSDADECPTIFVDEARTLEQAAADAGLQSTKTSLNTYELTVTAPSNVSSEIVVYRMLPAVAVNGYFVSYYMVSGAKESEIIICVDDIASNFIQSRHCYSDNRKLYYFYSE